MDTHDSTGDEREEPTEAVGEHADAAERVNDTEREQVREQSFDCDGPAELDVSIDAGRISVRLTEAAEVHVEVRAEPRMVGGWTQGLTGLINWIGDTTFSSGMHFPVEELGAAAVRATEIDWSAGARRLLVRAPVEFPLRAVPLAVMVQAPAESRVSLRTGAGDITVTGRAGRADVRTGSGEVTLESVTGDVEVRSGSGRIDVGDVGGRTHAKTGSGRIRLSGLAGTTEVKAGSSEVQIGAVRADLRVHTGSGDLTISDAHAGRLDLTTGSGDLRVGVHGGVAAELDLFSGSGRARSDLDVTSAPPGAGSAKLVIRGRTGSGDVLVTRAV